MKKIQYFVVILLTTLAVSGCATIVSGTKQTMTFSSVPEGATVTVSGRVLGKTPLTIDIAKDKHQTMTFQLDGYKTFTTQLSTRQDGFFWGNIVIGGLFGSSTDAASGAMYEFSQDQYFITLNPENDRVRVRTSSSRKIKELVIGLGDELRLELAQGEGEGETSDALLNILEIEDANKKTNLKILKKLSFRNENDIDFANKIIEFYEIS